MAKLFLWLNWILVVIGLGVVYYIIFNINPVESNFVVVWALIGSLVVIIWSITALFGYYIRLFIMKHWRKNKNAGYILMRSERQGVLLGVLFGIQLALQGFLLFNILSATILIVAILLLEFLFISQETK